MVLWPQRRHEESGSLTSPSSQVVRPSLVRLQASTGLDDLTGLPTFDTYQTALRHEWDWARRLHTSLSLIQVSADNLADYNDKHGREAGDALLRHLAQQLTATTRRQGKDVVARLLGTHFAVILPNTSAAGAVSFARRLRANIQTSGRVHAADHLTIRLSVATLRPDRRATWDELELEALAQRGLAHTEPSDSLVSLSIAVPAQAHDDL